MFNIRKNIDLCVCLCCLHVKGLKKSKNIIVEPTMEKQDGKVYKVRTDMSPH